MCSLKNSQNVFMQSLPLGTSCLFSMLLNDGVVETEKPEGIFSLNFVVDKFSRLDHIRFLNSSMFSIIHLKPA